MTSTSDLNHDVKKARRDDETFSEGARDLMQMPEIIACSSHRYERRQITGAMLQTSPWIQEGQFNQK